MFYLYTFKEWEELTFEEFKRIFCKHLLLTSDKEMNDFVDSFWHDAAVNTSLEGL